MADTTPPVLTDLIFPTTLDVSGGDATFTITADATDVGSGVQTVYVSLSRPYYQSYGTYGYLNSGLYVDDNTDSFADGSSSQSYTVSPYSAGGFDISYVTIYDKSGNSTSYNQTQLQALGIGTHFDVVGAPVDSSPPILTSLAIPTNVDVSAGNADFTVTAGADDAGSGIAYVYLGLDHSFLTTGGYLQSGFQLYDFNDTFADDGLSSQTETFTAAAAGSFDVTYAYIYDKAGNYVYYSAADLQARGINTHIDVAGPPADVTAPVLQSLTLPASVDVSQGNATFTVSAQATDQGTGVQAVYVFLDHPFLTTYDYGNGTTYSYLNYGFYLYNSTDSFADGTSAAPQTFTPAAAGVFNVTGAEVIDNAGNYTYYSPDQLRALGIATAFIATESSSNSDAPIQGTDGPDTLTGTDGDNTLLGYGGDDHLIGLKGNDGLIGGPGFDVMIGGDGNDSYEVANGGDQVIENPGEGRDIVYASTNWTATAGSEIEKLVASGTGAVYLTGNAFPMEIVGNAAVNRLDDGGGRDTLEGGGGGDVYLVHNAGTQVMEDPDGGYDTVRTDLAAYTLPANVESLIYLGTGDFTGTGNAQSNIITGGAGKDTLDGGANTDGKGDRLVGGGGDDTYYTHSAKDFVAEDAGGGFDTVFTTQNSALANPNVEALAFIGAGNFTGFAAAQGTSVTGGTGNDRLYGAAGADTLDGGAGGSDVLKGAGGADTFVIHGGPGVTRVVDFTVGVDHLSVQVNPGDIVEFLTRSDNFDQGDEGHPGDGYQYHYFFYDQAVGRLYDEGQFFSIANGVTYGGLGQLVATFDNHPALTGATYFE